jgi:hypothetical protein
MTPVATEHALVPVDTVAETSGEGAPFEVAAAGPRLFVIRLEVTQVIEQESLELSIQGSTDGAEWAAMPLLKFPQRFYAGSSQMALDLSARPEIKFIRARWELNRWGRGRPQPRFRFGVTLRSAG